MLYDMSGTIEVEWLCIADVNRDEFGVTVGGVCGLVFIADELCAIFAGNDGICDNKKKNKI